MARTISSQLFDFAFAEIGRLIGDLALLSETADDFGPSGFYEAGELVEIVAAGRIVGQLNADQNGRLALYALLAIYFLHYESRLLWF